MKTRALIITLLVIGIVVSAEAATLNDNVPLVMVVKHEWYLESAALVFDFAFAPQVENCDRQSPIGHPKTRDVSEELSRRCTPIAMVPQKVTSEGYVYRVTIQNNGARSIKGIEWDYVFSDPETNEELARHRFYSGTTCPLNKTKTLVGESLSPPTRVIAARLLYRKHTYMERVEIRRVVY